MPHIMALSLPAFYGWLTLKINILQGIHKKFFMPYCKKYIMFLTVFITSLSPVVAQKNERVTVVKSDKEKKADVFIGGKFFTSFLYPDTLEKPVLFPIQAPGGTMVTRGFPLNPQPGDPNDHPHHTGLWFNFENVNGLDFWNNSYAIPKDKKSLYGWIKADSITQVSNGIKGSLSYHAKWVNQANDMLLEENTRFEFSGTKQQRTIDRVAVLTAATDVVFTDAKDGLLGLRLAHALQIPTDKDQQFTDDKGIVTVVKAGTDKIANGNYLSSEGKLGDSVWGTRGKWCKVFGRIGTDSVSVSIIDHPKNPNYPTFWHARGYGLFAANPLGEKIFTNGKNMKNLKLKKGEAITFRYRIVIRQGATTTSVTELNKIAAQFAKEN